MNGQRGYFERMQVLVKFFFFNEWMKNCICRICFFVVVVVGVTRRNYRRLSTVEQVVVLMLICAPSGRRSVR